MTTAASPAKSYARHWALFVAAAAGLFWILNSRSQILPPRASRAFQSRALNPATLDKDWFFIIKMPEISQDLGDPTAEQAKFNQWLDALLEKGYKPLLLSDALNRIHQGQSIPKRAVVISFDPGYRRTYEVFSAVLQQRGVPALWLTDESAIKRAHMGYLSRHQLGLMKKSGLWDVGLKAPSGKFTLLTTKEEPSSTIRILNKQKMRFDTDHAAFNASIDTPLFNRLSVNSDWTKADLLLRLEAEVPVGGKSHLTAQPIQDRLWGIALPTSLDSNSPSFDLFTEPLKRFGSVSWLSTGGCADLQLDIQAKQVNGELWVFLRSKPELDERLAVGFTPEGCVIEEVKKGAKRLLGRSFEPAAGESPFASTIELAGQTLKVSINGREQLVVDNLTNGPQEGIVELLIYDKVRQAAQAKGVTMTLTPKNRRQNGLDKGGAA